MKDEINKIIQSISDFYKLDNALKYYLDRHKAQILLDYITNLQKTQETLIKNDNEIITNLQEENEKLKELCDKYEEEHSTAFKLWTMKMKEMPDYEEKMNYKSRIDKAVKYIKNDWYELNTRDIEHCINLNKDIRIDLLNILQGENNDI